MQIKKLRSIRNGIFLFSIGAWTSNLLHWYFKPVKPETRAYVTVATQEVDKTPLEEVFSTASAGNLAIAHHLIKIGGHVFYVQATCQEYY